MLFNKQVQRAFLRVDSISARNQDLQAKNRQLRSDSDKLNAQLATLQQSVSSSQSAAHEANQKAYQAGRKAGAARIELVTTRGRLTEARTDLTAAQTALVEARRGEQAAREQVRTAQKRYNAAQQRYTDAQQRVLRANLSVEQKQRQLEQASGNVRLERQRLETARNRLKTAQNRLKTAENSFNIVNRNLRTVNESVKNTLEDLKVAQTELERNRADVSKLREQIAVERSRLVALGAVTEQSWKGRIVVNLGQVLAERQIGAGLSQDDMERQIRTLLTEASRVVQAAPISARSVSLATRTVPLDNGGSLQLGEREIMELLTQYLATFNQPVAIRLAAARNYFEGETEVQGLLLAVPIQKAFPRGTTLAQIKVAGAQSDAHIFNQLLALVNSGEKAARERGVTPPLTPEAPNFYAGGTNERIFEALRQIQAHKGTVDVRLVAADDLTTVEPLRVRFDVGSPGTGSS
jgi:uncharacterized protein (DUF3084 family)